MAGGSVVEDVRGYYRRILPFYENESLVRAHLSFWRAVARRERPRRILEIGAGLGRITAELALAAPAVGIDISLEMLAAGSRSLGCRASFVAADMRRTAFGAAFDLVVAPSDPLSHLTRMEERRRALRAVARQLVPEGRFVLEGLYRRPGERGAPPRSVRHAAGVLRIEEDWSPLPARDLWLARYRYRDRRPGEPDRTLEASFTARAWRPGEMRPLFASCGLAIEEIWGDFDRRPFREGARRLIVVARRLR